MKRKYAIITIICCLLILLLPTNTYLVKAQSLEETIEEQISNIDFKDLEDYFNSNNLSNEDFITVLKSYLSGEYTFDYTTMGDYVKNIFLNYVYSSLPLFISIIVIALFCGIMQTMKSGLNTESITNITFWVCFLSVVLLLGNKIISLYYNTKNTIENIAKLTQIMSPIVLTLMVAAGGNVSASMYTPAVTFLSGGIINLLLSVVLPLVGVFAIFSVMSNFSKNIKLNKFADLSTGIIKWLIGLTITIFTIFISIQGITGANYDGISLRAAKYAISNTVPIVGGFISGGFDLVVAGSVLIKNAVGVTTVIALFATLISPVLELASISLLLKLTAALTEPITDVRISNFCVTMSKCISYFVACIIMVSFMLFILVVLMILSANAFI